MKTYQLFLFTVLFAPISFMACEKPSEPPKPTPVAVPTPIPTPTPKVVLGPTPVPEGPPFQLIRSNREVMTEEQIYTYGNNLSGKKVAGWIGYFHKSLASGETGKSRIVLDMDKNAGGLPDIVLEEIPSKVAESLSARQELNFSGTIQGYVDIPEARFLLQMGDVEIFGYGE